MLIAAPFAAFSRLVAASPSSASQVAEKTIRAELQLSIGSDAENEDFFNPSYFTIGRDGRIYVLDSGNSRVQCFSAAGKFLFSFGKFGQGPGELSKEASKIALLEDENVYIVDNTRRKIHVYSKAGEFQKSYILFSVYDDISLRNQTYYLSNLILKEGHHPVHSTRDLNNIDKSFGAYFEPTPGILKAIAKSPFLPMLERQFAFPIIKNFTNIVVNSKEEIIYSQSNPYHLVKYSKEGLKVAEVIGRVDFETHFPLNIEFGKDSLTYHNTSPPAHVYASVASEDDTFFVPVMSPDRSFIFLDVYDSDLRQLARYKLPNIFFDPKKKEDIAHVDIDQKRNLYCLVVSSETNPQLRRYELHFE
jgi:hypothetical protein